MKCTCGKDMKKVTGFFSWVKKEIDVWVCKCGRRVEK